jgi:hypothetical protein
MNELMNNLFNIFVSSVTTVRGTGTAMLGTSKDLSLFHTAHPAHYATVRMLWAR